MEFSIEEQEIIELYNQINLGHCEIRMECKRNNSELYDRAVGMWFVGKKQMPGQNIMEKFIVKKSMFLELDILNE